MPVSAEDGGHRKEGTESSQPHRDREGPRTAVVRGRGEEEGQLVCSGDGSSVCETESSVHGCSCRSR